MFKAVIFDSDGMLTDGARFSDRYTREHNLPADKMTPFFSGPFKKCLVGEADLKEELEKGWLTEWEWDTSANELIEYWVCTGDSVNTEVLNTIPLLREKGLICLLATNQEKYRTEHLSQKLGDVFNKIFSSAHTGQKKPSMEFFDIVFSHLTEQSPLLEKSEVVFWDDDEENVAGAAMYGFTARRFTTTEDYMLEMKTLGLL